MMDAGVEEQEERIALVLYGLNEHVIEIKQDIDVKVDGANIVVVAHR